ncbi:P-loop NTPase family protein [Flavicella sediminum]|uniref:hypothetical protein n=1 Tax=Flavicella sediminum TaxID=2585141 RepID=UPI001121A567|nr:hypothetical protein [Flavicella sediminum]
MTNQKTDTSKYDFEKLKIAQGAPDRRGVHKAIPMSEALKKYFKNSKKEASKKEKLVDKKDLLNIFMKTCANFYGPGKHFVIDDENRAVVIELLAYFSRSNKFGKLVRNQASLDKGILLFGECGLGKSDLFEVFRRMGKFLAGYGYMQMFFKSHTAKDLVNNKIELSKKANERDTDFIRIDFEKGNIYIDDVGTEPKFFTQEVIADILQQRYIKSKSNPRKTYITTNLKPSEIGERYGKQVDDRLREMFNIIKWEGDSRRK